MGEDSIFLRLSDQEKLTRYNTECARTVALRQELVTSYATEDALRKTIAELQPVQDILSENN